MRFLGVACSLMLTAALAACDGGVGDYGVDADPSAPDGNVDGMPMMPEPDFDTIPWNVIGVGVNFKDTQNPRGNNIFIADAGYAVDDDQAKAWLTALYKDNLRDRGVRYVYAVRGPATVSYSGKEIQNTHLIAQMLPQITDATHFIAIAGHSSGGYVACELMQQLFEQGMDPMGKTSGRTVYYDLDGVESCVDSTIVSHLRNVYFVSAHTNVGGGGSSLNAMYMMVGGMIYGTDHFKFYDASDSGCNPQASLCLHVSLVNTHPNDPNNGTPSDYADFSHGMANHWWLDATATDLPK
jgi:hypothetical protein